VAGPFIYGLVLATAGLAWLVTGEPFDTETYGRIAHQPWETMRESMPLDIRAMYEAMLRLAGGNSALLAGILTSAISATAFRKGERWAWFILCMLPFHAALDLLVLASLGALGPAALVWDAGLFCAMAVVLAASYRVIFRRAS
jgi:hypothetical protein